ncbi:MAG: sterol desaturase family protein [Flavobacteriaceae bacterium]
MRDLEFFDYTLAILSANLGRYIVICGSFFLVFYVFFRSRWSAEKIQSAYPKNNDYLREFTYSILTLLIFVGVALLVFYSPLREYNMRYSSIDQYGWGYWWFSVLAMILLHDTYFYWTHRAMHHPKVYRYVHLVHHLSRNPSPWAAFAFHPLEAIVEAGIVIFIAFLFPFHITALLTFLIFMTVYNAYGHLGFELYPKGFQATWVGKWINTSVAHNQHHEKFNGNYGLYFLFWDRWMGTLRTDYDKQFTVVDQKKGGRFS